MKNLYDIGYACLIVFVVMLIFGLTKDFSFKSLPTSMLFFVMWLVFPFIAISHEPIGLLYLALFASLFIFISRYVPLKYRKYSLIVAIAGWEYYGLYCMILVTGGA